MRSRLGVALVCAVAVSLVCASAAGAERPVASWYTSAVAEQVGARAAPGMDVHV